MTRIKTDAVDDQGDIVYYPIAEWKDKFGEPGSGADINGRINGFLPTEPCFCEPTIESQDELIAEWTELDNRISELKQRGASIDTIRPLIEERTGLARIIGENDVALQAAA